MASAQVQHDGRVIGSVVAHAFHREMPRFSRHESLPTSPRFLALRRVRQRNPTSFHAFRQRLESRNETGVPLHLVLYFVTSSQCSKRLI